MSISGNIRTFRKKAGITQIDLANQLGISIATLRRWEAGETAPTGLKIPELAKILGVTPEDIVAATPKQVFIANSEGVEGRWEIARTVENGFSAGMGIGTGKTEKLVFENGGTRIELPPTEKGYEIFNKLVENLLQKNK